MKVTLRAVPGITIIEVAAPGGPSLHVTIRGLTLGGNCREGSSEPAIRLLGDGYTEVANNLISVADLPVNNGIVLAQSDHPHLHANTFQGHPAFGSLPVLVVGRTTAGFGVVSAECLRLPGLQVSGTVPILTNLFTGTLTAGVWLCSDGAGRHELSGNVLRDYWRGIALKDATDTVVSQNHLIGGRSDGVIVYSASQRNRVERNHIESHVAPDAAVMLGWYLD